MTLRLSPLEGRLVWLRPFGPDDITDDYIGWLNDPRVVRFSNQRFRAHDRASCEAYLASFAGTPNFFVSVHERAGDRAIGTMTAYVNPRHQTVDVGIMIGEPDRWGGGYGQDAWSTLTDWLIAQPEVRKLTAGTLACNQAMVRLMERSHMRHEATRKAQELVDGAPQDIVYYARFAGL
ncbi:GNAT family N-acetyltransferase [Sphingopyxis sp.]|jgi:ribosomal-protein-alanine N-acetyltransferase|uniref:GNAT family N-acetyltransferase n=1 Tax=Sphingopyxis sp. TaxID=1908224 RepID=UPI003F714BB8